MSMNTPDSGETSRSGGEVVNDRAVHAVTVARQIMPDYRQRPTNGMWEVDPGDHYSPTTVAVEPSSLAETDITSARDGVEINDTAVLRTSSDTYLGERWFYGYRAEGPMILYPGDRPLHDGFLDTFMVAAPDHGVRASGWQGTRYSAKPYTLEVAPGCRETYLNVKGENFSRDAQNERGRVKVSLPKADGSGHDTYLLRYQVKDGVIMPDESLFRELPPEEQTDGVELIYSVPRGTPQYMIDAAELAHFMRHHARVEFDSAEGARVLDEVAGLAESILAPRAGR